MALSISHDAVERGSVLVKKGDALKGVTCFTAQLMLLREWPGAVRVGWNPYFFLATRSFAARVDAIVSLLNKAGQVVQNAPAEAKAGDTIIVQLSCVEPIAADVYATCPPLGRFAVRDGHKTVAVGIIKSIDVASAAPPAKAAAKKGKYFK